MAIASVLVIAAEQALGIKEPHPLLHMGAMLTLSIALSVAWRAILDV